METALLLQQHRLFLTVILHRLIWLLIKIQSFGFILAYFYNAECSLLQHAGECTFCGADAERLFRFVPGERDPAELPFLIVIIQAFIFIERELCVFACIYIERNSICSFFTSVLQCRAERQECCLLSRTGAYAPVAQLL